MNKLPLALWMLGWWPASYLTDYLASLARQRPASEPSGDVVRVDLVLWVIGGLILWPWNKG